MKTVNLNDPIRNKRGRTAEQWLNDLAIVGESIRMMVGGANNCAYLLMGNALDAAKKLPEYKSNYKNCRKELLTAHKMYSEYERRLFYGEFTSQMFSRTHMLDDTLKRYGDITTERYIELWQLQGAALYERTYPFIRSLMNKYKTSMDNHDVPNSEQLQHMLTACAGLYVTKNIFQDTIKAVSITNDFPEDYIKDLFLPFSLEAVAKQYHKAICLFTTRHIDGFTELEERNIELGLLDLNKEWSKEEYTIDTLIDAAEAAPEMFRTSGEQAKHMRELCDIKEQLYNTQSA